MTCLPTWIVDALDRGLPMLRGRERDELAELILAALPKHAIAETIAKSTQAVLKTRGIQDAAGDLSREVGNNAGAAVLLMLQVGDECSECGGTGFVEYDAEGNEARCVCSAPKESSPR